MCEHKQTTNLAWIWFFFWEMGMEMTGILQRYDEDETRQRTQMPGPPVPLPSPHAAPGSHAFRFSPYTWLCLLTGSFPYTVLAELGSPPHKAPLFLFLYHFLFSKIYVLCASAACLRKVNDLTLSAPVVLTVQAAGTAAGSDPCLMCPHTVKETGAVPAVWVGNNY